MGSGFDKAIYFALTRRSTPHKLETLSFLSWILVSDPFSCGILPVRSISVSVFLSHSWLCTPVLYWFSCSVLVLYCTALPRRRILTRPAESESELLYDWRFTAKPLETHRENFFQLNTCGNSPYVTSLWRENGFVSYEYAWPYSILMKFFILQYKQHYTTSHVVWDESLKAESHLYVSLTAVYWAHRAICIKC
jgi:hypothetical protein